MKLIRVRIGALAVLLCSFAGNLYPQTPTPPDDSSIAVVIVTILTKKSAAPAEVVQKEDIIIREGGIRKPTMALIPARGDHASLQLAIVIDDSGRRDTGNQFQSLKKFIEAQGPSTSVGLYYALGGSLRAAAQLSPDHAAAANALRPPQGDFGNLVSPFVAISQLIGHWPLSMVRREILLLSPGFDPMHQSAPDPDVQHAIEQAQLSGILVHPIQINPPGRLSLYSDVGRNNLTELADETGGASLLGALMAPLKVTEETGGAPVRDTIPTLDLSPVLKSLNTVLDNQYFLVWKTTRSKNKGGELRSFTLRAEDSALRITAPAKVFVP